MDQGIIAALKRKYKSKMLHAMVKNLERYDELQAGGASIAAGVRGLHAYPPNLLDDATLRFSVYAHVAYLFAACNSQQSNLKLGWE